jgi:hypothetical protein
MAPVTPGFFETLRIPLLAGRTFARRDFDPESSGVIIVSEAFAERYFGRDAAVGRMFEGRFSESDTFAPHEIIGVVADARYDLREPAAPTLYILLPLRSNGTLHVRVAGDPLALASRLRDEVRTANPLFRVTSVTTQSAVVDQTLLRERLLARLSGFFAVVGLVLAALGLYGLLTYSVVERTRELGIRIALGARQLRLIGMVLTDAGRTAVLGVACGLAGGLYLSRFVEALLFEVTPLDLWSLALPVGTLVLTALVAASLPALRAARVDPAIALRYD